ncbi:hypothetical protein [Helicobacter pylori]|uniref:Uncharacterized protein n=1 Tax=Helicobacter pylori TaxID=210 RepID=A0AAC8N2Y5_HELPX|nr:hypothetical protein [Helicobacter pylori]AFV44203.1 hypothetical protein C695_07175 [Helicobacter pylori Rif1]AFV45796.1 hypothetical protein C730_07175 [Helicobacter pylori Rif2]AJF09603.1 hypothetical protein SE87_07145 [Helicobacter pylori 26695-1]OUC10269.1 hypothetical protein X568_06790 [Helicobacter pylori SS1]AFV42608.1 hypothetical protein C694_07165 [Helicobacter pylori 26695]
MIKEITKALVRIDNKVKINNEQLQQSNADMYSIVAKVVLLENRLKTLQQEVSKLKKEIAQLKQVKK